MALITLFSLEKAALFRDFTTTENTNFLLILKNGAKILIFNYLQPFIDPILSTSPKNHIL